MSDVDDDNCALLTKKFAKFFKKTMKKPNVDRKEKQPFVKKNLDQLGHGAFSEKFSKEHEKKNKDIKCFECEGYGHIQSECANTLKKKGKTMTTTLG